MPGPFIWPVVMGLQEPSCLTCLTCNSYLTRNTKPPAVMLPMDQYMKKKVDALKADIISGKIKVADYMADNACKY